MKTGYIVLEGGAEFGGQMAAPDRRAIELADGLETPIRIIPTAAAPDHNHQRAGQHGVSWFEQLGATDVQALPLIDRTSANEPALVATLRQARLIYLLGGFTDFLGQTLSGSAAWEAMLAAYAGGAVLVGSSAGAMVLCQYYFDPSTNRVVQGLGLVPNACVLPHHNTFGKRWAAKLAKLLPGVLLLGIDERTGMIDDGDDARKTAWRVYGQGAITLYRDGSPKAYQTGERLTLAAQ